MTKTISRQDTTSWRLFKPDKCGICGAKAEYILRAFSFWRGTRYEQLCEKHKQEWILGTLTL